MKKQQREEKGGVEELLQAAADEMVLKLSVNSHMARGVSPKPNYNYDCIPSDLDRRFQALKSTVPTAPSSQSTAAVVGDDLSARFAALKASLSSSAASEAKRHPLDNHHHHHGDEDEDDDDDDEVQKLIRWAKDAARLDPSPPSDDDDGK